MSYIYLRVYFFLKFSFIFLKGVFNGFGRYLKTARKAYNTTHESYKKTIANLDKEYFNRNK